MRPGLGSSCYPRRYPRPTVRCPGGHRCARCAGCQRRGRRVRRRSSSAGQVGVGAADAPGRGTGWRAAGPAAADLSTTEDRPAPCARRCRRHHGWAWSERVGGRSRTEASRRRRARMRPLLGRRRLVAPAHLSAVARRGRRRHGRPSERQPSTIGLGEQRCEEPRSGRHLPRPDPCAGAPPPVPHARRGGAHPAAKSAASKAERGATGGSGSSSSRFRISSCRA